VKKRERRCERLEEETKSGFIAPLLCFASLFSFSHSYLVVKVGEHIPDNVGGDGGRHRAGDPVGAGLTEEREGLREVEKCRVKMKVHASARTSPPFEQTNKEWHAPSVAQGVYMRGR
jgi:hypothetical protein